MIGYSLWSARGKQLWSHDKALQDHADGISAGSFGADPAAPPRVYICGSDEGFLMFDRAGQDPEAGAHRTRADAERRQVPARNRRAADL